MAKLIKGVNDLQTLYPNIAKEWNYSKNGTLRPDMVTAHSNMKVWWIYPYDDVRTGKHFDFEWEAIIGDRVDKDGKCPFLSNRLYKGFNDLETSYPNIAREWNYSKNGDLLPSDFTSKNGHKVWWKCSSCDNEWEAKISNRTSRGSGCPICGRKDAVDSSRKTRISKDGSLEDNFPNLNKEWNYEKNGSLLPSMVMSRSSRKVWWICEKGHEWRTSISGRTDEGERATGCPECNRTGTSFPEQALIFYLKKYFEDVKNNDKHLKVELDVFIPSRNIAIEYDGRAWHETKTGFDIKKNDICKQNEVELIRIREPGLERLDDCICFYRTDDRSNDSLSDVISEVLNYIGVDGVNVDVERDSIQIMAQYKLREYSDSLEALFPIIANEWNYKRNGSLVPSNVKAKSNKKVWWKCSEGHEWYCTISWMTDSRRGKKTRCPYCSKGSN